MHPMLNTAVTAARQAGNLISRSFGRVGELQVTNKARNDFVTDVDRLAEQTIIDIIHKAYPSDGFLAEESGATDESEYTWIIDPLDGTLNFIQGIPHFAVSIGVRKGNHLEHGVIVDPIRHEEFVASRGYGAQLNGKRIRVSTRNKLHDCVLGTGIPPGSIVERLDPYMVTLTEFTRECRGIRRAGSAALDLAYVAAGRTDGFWEMGLSKWDIAAGVVLVREAGGFIADLEGGETYWQSGDIAAANPKVMRSMLQTLKAANT